MILRGAALFVCALFSLGFGRAAALENPHAILTRSIEAMGGRPRLAAIVRVEYVAVGTRAMVEQSERPTGPYLIDHLRVHELLDFDAGRARIERTDEGYAADAWWLQQPTQRPSVEILDGNISAVAGTDGTLQYGGGFDVTQTQERIALGPERLLLTADAANDLQTLPDVTLHGVRHHVVKFSWNGSRNTLYINADANLPWQLVSVRPYPYQIFLNAWGDVTTKLTFTGWSLEPSGVHYPREWTYERVGVPDEQLSVVQLHFNPTFDTSSLAIPTDILAAHVTGPRAIADKPFVDDAKSSLVFAPGVLVHLDSWNVGFVNQPDGAIVIEAPIAPNYAKQAFTFARRHFGRVKAIVTTSDSWPHIAGVRQAAAEAIPIYALDQNVAILTRLIRAPHAMRPDDLARTPRAPDFRIVRGPTAIGSGPNRIVILPYRTVTAERQMMVWLPERRLLYTSDLFAPEGPTRWFTPQYLDEAIGAVRRYDLDPVTVWGMHYGATPFATLVDALRAFLATPVGAAP